VADEEKGGGGEKGTTSGPQYVKKRNAKSEEKSRQRLQIAKKRFRESGRGEKGRRGTMLKRAGTRATAEKRSRGKKRKNKTASFLRSNALFSRTK